MNVFQPGETPIMPKHAFDGIDISTTAGVRGAPIMQKPIGTGPFRFKEWSKGSFIAWSAIPITGIKAIRVSIRSCCVFSPMVRRARSRSKTARSISRR